MAAQHVVESALLSSSSSLFRGDTLSGRAQSQAAYRASLGKPAAGLRYQFSTNRVVGPQTKASYRKGRVHATNGNFGAALAHGYAVTEPKKVDGQSVGSADSSVIDKLKEGFIKFKNEKFLVETDVFEPLKEAQSPKVSMEALARELQRQMEARLKCGIHREYCVMFIACGDSRVCPTLICGLNAGEAFVIRNVANLVPPVEKSDAFPGTSAALEFAVNYLKVEHIIVCGHSACGGIKALMSRSEEELNKDWIGNWILAAKPARDRTLVSMEGKSFADQCKYCEQEAVNVSLANLLTFPWIKEKFEAGTLGLHGWYYNFIDGELTSWEVKRPSLVAA